MRYVVPVVSTTVNSVPVADTELRHISQWTADLYNSCVYRALTTLSVSNGLSVERRNAAVPRSQQRRRSIVNQRNVGRSRDQRRRQRGAALEVLHRHRVRIKGRGLVVGKGARVLDKAGAPVVLRGLLDGRSVELAAVADAKVDAVAVELGLVREGARGGGISWRCGV